VESKTAKNTTNETNSATKSTSTKTLPIKERKSLRKKKSPQSRILKGLINQKRRNYINQKELKKAKEVINLLKKGIKYIQLKS